MCGTALDPSPPTYTTYYKTSTCSVSDGASSPTVYKNNTCSSALGLSRTSCIPAVQGVHLAFVLNTTYVGAAPLLGGGAAVLAMLIVIGALFVSSTV
jgi:hypothetical protein